MRKILASALLLVLAITMHGQKSLSHSSTEEYYRKALSLFEREKFVAAQKAFQDYQLRETDESSELYVNAVYYSAICDLYLFHKSAEFHLEEFIETYPNSHWNKMIYFDLASYNYQRKRYKKALQWYEKVDVRQLNEEQQLELKYKRGHSSFTRKDYESARQDFFEVKSEESEYKIPATYYYSHITYVQEDYQTALIGFKEIENEEEFKSLVPYYISQIYYALERYDRLIEYASPKLDSGLIVSVERKSEISHLLGDAHYRNEDFEKALPYIEFYHQATDRTLKSREDYYQFGYTLYRVENYNDAVSNLSLVRDEQDELYQSSVYHMADCYLEMGEKTYARNAFKEAAALDYNTKVKEDALFNYAKLSYELSYNPFHESITAFEDYIETYPNTERADEAYSFLLNVYMNSKNYDAALKSLGKIKKKNAAAKEAFQFLSFNRGVELYNAREYEESRKNFMEVSRYDVDPSLTSESFFWLAEIAFRNQRYTDAVTLYNRFKNSAGAYNSKNYNDLFYGSGYALFKQFKYLDAATAFRKFLEEEKDESSYKRADAQLRIGDCYYVKKDYAKAIKYYDGALKGEYKKDYALFQKAICLGLNGDNAKKAQMLESFLKSHPESVYLADVKYELAVTYKDQSQYKTSLASYQSLIKDHPNSPYVKKSWLDILLVHFKMDDSKAVVETWDFMKEEYNNDPILADAYQIAEPVLIEADLMGDLPEVLDKSEQEIDFKTFEAAREYALDDNCNKAIKKLSSYLVKFEPAFHAAEANYYLGRCYFESGDSALALNAFNYVISQPVGDFTEECLLLAATINYNSSDYEAALINYRELENVAVLKNNLREAEVGMMRCSYFLEDFVMAKKYANRVIASPDSPNGILKTAYLWRARMYFDQDVLDSAYYDFSYVNDLGGIKGAESKYRMALIGYKKEAYKASEKEIFELIEKYSVYDEWKFKAFLLLSDVYVGLEDYFQAKATLNAIIENVKEDWVVVEANERLQAIDEIENPRIEEELEEETEEEIEGEEVENEIEQENE